MKRFFPLVLCCILLAGCGTKTALTGTPLQPLPSLYAADSRLDNLSAGVTAFPLETGISYSFQSMGNDLLLIAAEADHSILKRYTGAELQLAAESTASFPSDFGERILFSDENSICWYDSPRNAVITLDHSFQETGQILLPEALCGNPCFSQDRSALFCCSDSRIFVLDPKTGISRTLKETGAQYQQLTLLERDTVLYCQYPVGTGQPDSTFLSTENGSALRVSNAFPVVAEKDGTYFALRYEQQRQEILIQDPWEAPQVLIPGPDAFFLQFLPESNRILTGTYRPENETLVIDSFDAKSGNRTASLSLEQVSIPSQINQTSDGCVWFLLFDSQNQQDTLIRWNPGQAPANDPHVYLEQYFTREDPDIAGLNLCMERAAELSESHGISIRVYQDAVAQQPWDYVLEAEYLVPQLNWELDKLDRLLSYYPEGFFETLAKNYESISICLVRSITGTAESGTLDSADGLQFWEDNRGYIALAVGTATQYNLFHELSHMIDTQIMNTCSAYDNWGELNPDGFEYDFDYNRNLRRNGSVYLQEDDRAFIDTYAMSFPAEDRARIMEYAMNPNNAYLFQSPIMQAKLKQMCLGIRKAFQLTKYPEPLQWEQYLEHSLAYREWKK